MDDLKHLKEIFKYQVDWYKDAKKVLESESDPDDPIDINSYFYDSCIEILNGMTKGQAQDLLQILSKD